MIITSDIYCQHDQIKCDDMGQDVQHEGEEEDKYKKILVEKNVRKVTSKNMSQA